MRTLVTGVTGFAGGHLAEALLARGDTELVGLARRGEWPPALRHLAGRVALEPCDLGDGAAVETALRRHEPGRVYHLAGYAQAGRSLREPDAAWAGNLGATRALYDAIARWGGRPRVLFVGSGQVYGEAAVPGQPHGEDAPLRPANPYAASKAAADLLSYQVTRHPGLEVVRARPFNHVGPRQTPGYVVPDFARQVVAIERGARPPVLETGDLDALRDLSDVRDVVAAYVLLMEGGRSGEAYNVAAGVAVSMRAVLEHLLAAARVAVETRTRPDLLRPSEARATCGDAGKLRRETGWRPRFPLDRTLADTLEFWRQQP